MLSTHPKNISQIGSFPQVPVKIRHIWNHHPVSLVVKTTQFRKNKLPGHLFPKIPGDHHQHHLVNSSPAHRNPRHKARISRSRLLNRQALRAWRPGCGGMLGALGVGRSETRSASSFGQEMVRFMDFMGKSEVKNDKNALNGIKWLQYGNW